MLNALLGKKETCSICNQEETRKKLSDGSVCGKCLDLCGNRINKGKDLKIYSISEIKEAIEKVKEDELEIQNFKATQKVGKFIEFNDNKCKFLIPKKLFSKPLIYDYSEIVSFELAEDGDVVTKGGLGRALVGGALFGGVGAIVGGVTGGKTAKKVIKSMSVKITVDRKSNPVVEIVLLNSETKTDSFIYKGFKKQADEIIAILKVITNDKNSKEEMINSKISPADEILKYKALLDSGVITQEEFDKKKKELLNL